MDCNMMTAFIKRSANTLLLDLLRSDEFQWDDDDG